MLTKSNFIIFYSNNFVVIVASIILVGLILYCCSKSKPWIKLIDFLIFYKHFLFSSVAHIFQAIMLRIFFLLPSAVTKNFRGYNYASNNVVMMLKLVLDEIFLMHGLRYRWGLWTPHIIWRNLYYATGDIEIKYAICSPSQGRHDLIQ